MSTALIVYDEVAANLSAASSLLGVELHPTGSRVICPPVVSVASDHDFVCLVENLLSACVSLINDGWVTGTSFPDDAQSLGKCQFVSFAKGSVNLLVTQDAKWHDLFLLATRVAARLGLTAKEHRIALFQAILYGNG